MESIVYQVIKQLTKEFPNDMEFGNRVRRVIREIDGEVDNEIITNLKSKENGVQ